MLSALLALQSPWRLCLIYLPPPPREGRKVTLELKGARDFEVRSLQTKARLSPQKLHAGGRRDEQPVKSLEPDGNQRHSSTFGYLFS